MIPFPDKKYKIIYADPPWEYDNKNTGGHSNGASGKSAACQKYDVLSLDELCNLPVKELKDTSGCVLFLWVTTPLKYDIAKSGLLESWGFEYKTTYYWRKIMSLGMGFWFRGQVEECWLCIDGNIKAFGLQIPNFLQRRVRGHSEKPKEVRGLIDQVSTTFSLTPKIELFSRDKIEGWDCWGNEVPTDEQRLLVRDCPFGELGDEPV